MTDPDNLIEAVARALWREEWGDDLYDDRPEDEKTYWTDAAKAAILATLEGIGGDLRQLVRDTLMMALQRAEETSDSHVWIANLALEQFNDTLLASMKDGTHG